MATDEEEEDEEENESMRARGATLAATPVQLVAAGVGQWAFCWAWAAVFAAASSWQEEGGGGEVVPFSWCASDCNCFFFGILN
jgi:hypothetical protein